jgi:peptide-methionine (S)-S-oxide reductase
VAHDPTQLNRQGNDVGTQYRSAIFFHNAKQRDLAQYYIRTLDGKGLYSRPIVTEVKALNVFYVAEDYHKNYYALNRSNPYCVQVIAPKLEEFRKVFADKLKK